MPDFQGLIFTTQFLDSLFRLSPADQRRVGRALALLDGNEQHRSLRVHAMSGQQTGLWSASASRSLRIIFERLDSDRKRLIECSHHYGD